MLLKCPYCQVHPNSPSGGLRIQRAGHYWRKSDGHLIQRFSCLDCKKTYSQGIHSSCYQQNKRHLNHTIWKMLSSSVSMRRLAIVLGISRTTVARKLIFLAIGAKEKLRVSNEQMPLAETIEFDDIETFEHTKSKPLSITLVVQFPSRRILGFAVSSMPAKGKLAERSKKKYGKRPDDRRKTRKRLFESITPLIKEGALIKSDESPHYPKDVRDYFPKSTHETYKGRRGATTGYGELKKGVFDPLFCLNLTAACFRDSIKRLARRTWCTTKDKERLKDHIALFAYFYNTTLLNN